MKPVLWSASGAPVVVSPDPDAMVEVVRSFSYKLNVGNYESRDFFSSQKTRCRQSEAETMSAALYEFCKREVLASVGQYISDMRAQRRKGVQRETEYAA